MTLTVARNGISLVTSRALKPLCQLMKTRSATLTNISASTWFSQTTTTSRVWFPSAALLTRKCQCQPADYPRAYSEGAPQLTHRPSDFDKKILVWSKVYSSLDDIPEVIPHGKMKRAKDVFRIRVNIWMAIATVCGCVIMIYWGRKDAKEGKSVEKENMLWHQSVKEKAEREQSK